uniref:Uncharacterized protein n=1 Tax=Catharus ustulatus TaxID=91951 RepID=A0A8C3VDX1_CATUS
WRCRTPAPPTPIDINNLNEKIKKDELNKSLCAIFSHLGQILDILVWRSLRMRGQASVILQGLSSASNACAPCRASPSRAKPWGDRIWVAKKDSDIMAKVKGTFLGRNREQEQDKGAQGTVPVSYGVSSGVWGQFWGLGSVLGFGVRDAATPSGGNCPTSPPGMIPPPGMAPNPGMLVLLILSFFELVLSDFGSLQLSENPPNHILFLPKLPEETKELMLSMIIPGFLGTIPKFLGYHSQFFWAVPGPIPLCQVPGVPGAALQGYRITQSNAMRFSFIKK